MRKVRFIVTVAFLAAMVALVATVWVLTRGLGGRPTGAVSEGQDKVRDQQPATLAADARTPKKVPERPSVRTSPHDEPEVPPETEEAVAPEPPSAAGRLGETTPLNEFLGLDGFIQSGALYRDELEAVQAHQQEYLKKVEERVAKSAASVREAYEKLVVSQTADDAPSLQQPLQDFLGAMADQGRLHVELRRDCYDRAKRLLTPEHAQAMQDYYDGVVRPHVPSWSFDLPVRIGGSTQWYQFMAIRTDRSMTLQRVAVGSRDVYPGPGFTAEFGPNGRLRPIGDLTKWIVETPQ